MESPYSVLCRQQTALPKRVFLTGTLGLSESPIHTFLFCGVRAVPEYFPWGEVFIPSSTGCGYHWCTPS